MIAQVKDNGGTKTLEQISGSTPTGNPVGSFMYTYKKIQPRNYLYCDGSTFNAGQYPALYLYLGSNVLPDYRECTMVGAEENTTDNIATHDVYAQGEFKDDQIQNITGTIETAPSSGTPTDDTGAFQKESSPNAHWYSGGTANRPSVHSFDASRVARAGTTTHSKQKAVYVYIKAVDGVDISDEDTFLVTVKNFVEEKNSYSTTEMLTGGKWIDGKPIYRKVVDCGALTNNTAKNIAHNIQNISFVVDYYAISTNGSEWIGIPASWTTASVGITVDPTDIIIRPYSDRRTYTTTYAIIEYTKTTD